jgi:tetratricopeptide (TPR) repeat protein
MSKIYSYLAIKNYSKGNLKKARKYYKKAYEAKVKELPIVASYAYLLILLGEYDQAEEVLNFLESMKPEGKAATSLMLCNAVLKWKRDKNLIAALAKVEAMDETMRNQWYYNVYAKLCIFSGNIEKAIKGYEYLKTNPVAVENLLIIHCINAEYDKALSAAEKLINGKKNMKASSQDAYFYSALAYEMNNDFETAKKLYVKALQYENTTMTYIDKQIVLKKAGEYMK